MKRRLSLSFGAWLLLLSFGSRLDASGNDVGTPSDPVAALRQIIEEQNRRIEALSQKVLQLEQRVRESESHAQPTDEILPTIVIDTNGVPIAPAPPPSVAGTPPPAAAPTPNDTPSIPAPALLSVGPEGFELQSGDTNFVLRLRGLLQVDSRTFLNDSPFADGNNGFVLRRARPILEGTVFRDFDFRMAPDFAPSTPQLFDAHLNYRLRPEVQLRAGKIKPPIGLEQLQSDAYGLFNERSLATQLVPVRSVGAQLWGQIDAGSITYAVGGFGSNGDARNAPHLSISDDSEFAGRVFAEPWRKSGLPLLQGLGVGLGGSFSQIRSNAAALPSTLGGDHPGYLTTGAQQFFAYNPAAGQVVADGTHWRLAPQVSWRFGSFGLMGEYLVTEQGVLNATTLRSAQLQHHAWQCSAQWVLTGEPASFDVVQPRHSFNWSEHGWGAWQLVGRLGQMRLDPESFQGFSNPDTSAHTATAWSVGINWWLNRNVRLLLSYSQTGFDGAGGTPNPSDPATFNPPATTTQQDERVLMTRMQLAF
ncbi:MAG: hypothetical protein IT581_12895 [Verrucomicrobiales bacterium]|nr:hypothetical protein [Verrucomicrobiales bacterium]